MADDPIEIVYDSIDVDDDAISIIGPAAKYIRRLPKSAIPKKPQQVSEDSEIIIKRPKKQKSQLSQLIKDPGTIFVSESVYSNDVTNIAQSSISQTDFLQPRNNFKTFLLNEETNLIVMKNGAHMTLLGAFKFKVLFGCIDFNGCLANDKSWHYAYVSQLGPAACFTCSLNKNMSNYGKQLEFTFKNEGFDTISPEILLELKSYLNPKKDSLLLLSKYEVENRLLSVTLPILSNNRLIDSNPVIDDDIYGQTNLIDGVQLISFNPMFEDTFALAKNIKEKIVSSKSGQIVSFVGDKNSGKSTLIRFMSNRSLSFDLKNVYFLETDVGQSEFMIEGCISLVKINKPIFHLPQFGQTKVEIMHCSLYGLNSPAENRSSYLKCVKQCMDVYNTQYKNDNNILLVNTHGWVKDQGDILMREILSIVKPDLVVQIVSPTFSGFQWLESSEFGSTMKIDSPAMKARASEKSPFRSCVARRTREAQLLAYFSRKWRNPEMSNLFRSPIYKIALEKVALGSCKLVAPSQIFALINANFVGVGKISKDLLVKRYMNDETLPSIIEYGNISAVNLFGVMLVRGIDVQKSFLYLTGPLTDNVINKVNALVYHPVIPPVEFWANPATPEVMCPYMTKKEDLTQSSNAHFMINPAPQLEYQHRAMPEMLLFSKEGERLHIPNSANKQKKRNINRNMPKKGAKKMGKKSLKSKSPPKIAGKKKSQLKRLQFGKNVCKAW